MQGLFDGIFAGKTGVAQNLLTILGIDAEVHLKSCKDYDPSTGEEITYPDEIFPVKASPPEKYSIKEIDGTNIIQGDVKTIIGSADLERDISTVQKERLERSVLRINSEDLKIITVDPIYSGYQISAYTLQLRKD
jgi:hypothetical protein